MSSTPDAVSRIISQHRHLTGDPGVWSCTTSVTEPQPAGPTHDPRRTRLPDSEGSAARTGPTGAAETAGQRWRRDLPPGRGRGRNGLVGAVHQASRDDDDRHGAVS